MRAKVLVIVIIVVSLATGGFFVWKQFFAPKDIYKGVWMPSLGASLFLGDDLPEGLLPEGADISIMDPVFADLDKAKGAGINTLAFQMGYWVDEQGELTMSPGVKEFFASFIDEAHSRGVKIWLNPEILHRIDRGNPSEMRRIPEEWIENTDLIENFKDGIVEIAKFAQEHDVEIFSPSSEMHVNIGGERSRKVLAEIKPRIDAVYSGKICLRGEWPGDDLSEYSCFGPTIEMPKNEKEKKNLVDRIEQKKGKDIEIIMGELWQGNDWEGTKEDFRKGHALGLEAGKGRVSGFFILDVPRPYFDPDFKPGSDPNSLPYYDSYSENFESMIKELYTQEF